MKKKFKMICIVMMSNNNIIGVNDSLPWKIPNDLTRLREITMGCPLIMGRKTFDSLPKKLDGRFTIVLSRKTKKSKYFYSINNINEGIVKAKDWLKLNNTEENRIFLFGGGEIYKLGLKYCNEIEMTLVEQNIKGNIKFPTLNQEEWHTKILSRFSITDSLPAYKYIKFLRRKPVTI